MNAPQILESRLVPEAKRIVGSTLTQVDYRVLQHEATADEIDNRDFYLGGEVKLQFQDVDAIYVSWQQNAGWPDGTIFSLLLSPRTSGAFDELSANTTQIWSPHIGKTIQSASIIGVDNVPFVLSLQISASKIFLGSSYQNQFGDGDDVFISTDLASVSSLSTLWESTVN